MFLRISFPLLRGLMGLGGLFSGESPARPKVESQEIITGGSIDQAVKNSKENDAFELVGTSEVTEMPAISSATATIFVEFARNIEPGELRSSSEIASPVITATATFIVTATPYFVNLPGIGQAESVSAPVPVQPVIYNPVSSIPGDFDLEAYKKQCAELGGQLINKGGYWCDLARRNKPGQNQLPTITPIITNTPIITPTIEITPTVEARIITDLVYLPYVSR